jgi:stage V sporulation protein S
MGLGVGEAMARKLKVSSRSVPHSVAGALAGILREAPICEITVIGAGALNQAVKATAIARDFLSEDGLDLVCVPDFVDLMIAGSARTGLRLIIERRPAARHGDDDVYAERGRSAEPVEAQAGYEDHSDPLWVVPPDESLFAQRSKAEHQSDS